MNNASIGERLKYQRKIKGYSQEELAHRTNVTVRTIQRIEKEEVSPHLNTIKLLAVALEIEVDDLVVLTNPKDETLKKKWLLLMHATPLVGLFLPLLNVLIPLFLWIHKREDNPIYNEHGIKVINFQITALILAVLSFVSLLTIEKWGFFIFISVVPICVGIIIFNIIYVVQKNKCYYPFSIPFIRLNKNQLPTLLLLFGIIFFCSCSGPKLETLERLDGSLITKDSVTRKMNQLMEDAQIHGMAITVFNNNQPIYQKQFGYKDYLNRIPLTDSTNMYGASFSKAVFGILVMKMVEKGVIDLDTRLESYLPKKMYEYEPKTSWHDDFSTLKEDSLYHKITARMCLDHTTGFKNYRWFEEDYKLRVHSEPGTKFGYSGEGFIYLQVVLEKLTGKGLEELAQENIFKPLGMNNTAYEWKSKFENDYALGHDENGKSLKKDKDNEPRGGGTLETTTEDYTKFLTAVLSQKLISEESYNEIFSPHIKISTVKQFGEEANIFTDKYDDINFGYGLGWGYFETPYGKAVFKEGHGSGFVHHSVLFPETGKGVMIMTNFEKGNSIFKEILEVVMKDVYTPWEWENYIPYDKR
ncbi:serine hydrolase [Flagellimonas zhangzhouensis]|uniref:CubicO group peptidase, beta-lactamase class C family n=1 Tax=Flagellimonas zhangzhouensis TaxID=1073328 RepID=A0A1H2SL19_9FLAO|nr:serine hydrolase [Allomuricauda zhangzhouensis]SDQ76003.1 CubicO group peptidase, beta-lactamase class C family [Allomuricauda zhangzhouensis]SDW32145.1 CubicO group peptidase, beta-lactamase class C family [Allomuricauda zhangzhouensis]